jgi:hypothetical protein
MMKRKVFGLLAPGIILGAQAAHAGTTVTPLDAKDSKTTVIVAESNPLCFLDNKLCFDVQERLRGEYRENNFDFDSATNSLTDDSWLLQRFRIGMAVKPTDWFKLYVQGQDSREYESDRPNVPGVLGAEGDDTFDLRQAYIEIGNLKNYPLDLTVGRQILSYGDERLIGAFDWNNIGRTFDAVKLKLQQPKYSLDLFASTVVVPLRGRYNQSDFFNGLETHRDQVFAGAYFTTSAIDFQTTDLYVLYLHQNNPGALGTTTDTSFATLGTRIKADPTKLHGFEYDGEFAFQAGTVTDKDLLAAAAHVGVGYNWFDVWGKPRLYAEYNYASGDSDPTDGNVGTFQNLFPTNHKFYGYMDLFSWQNLSEPAIWFRVNPLKTVAFEVSYHAYWLATTNDSWYRANGVTTVRPLTPAARAADSFCGTEIDTKVTWNVNKHFALEGGYSHFFAGAYLKDTGPHSDADFAYVMTTINF